MVLAAGRYCGLGDRHSSSKTKEGRARTCSPLSAGGRISSVIVASSLSGHLFLPRRRPYRAVFLHSSGLIAGVLIGYFTEYYTSDTYKPTRKLAGTTKTGSATVIIGGSFAAGMLSTVIPVVIVGASVLVSYFVAGGAESYTLGIYGIGISAIGMLFTQSITLATDAYGPIADNAGGLAETTGMPEVVRERTDALDSLGNTTAATGKGFAIALRH